MSPWIQGLVKLVHSVRTCIRAIHLIFCPDICLHRAEAFCYISYRPYVLRPPGPHPAINAAFIVALAQYHSKFRCHIFRPLQPHQPSKSGSSDLGVTDSLPSAAVSLAHSLVTHPLNKALCSPQPVGRLVQHNSQCISRFAMGRTKMTALQSTHPLTDKRLGLFPILHWKGHKANLE